jgi:hypothetical protein
LQFPGIRIRRLPGTAAVYPARVTGPCFCGEPIVKSHPLEVIEQRQQESHRRDENPRLQFPFSNLGEPMQEPRQCQRLRSAGQKTKNTRVATLPQFNIAHSCTKKRARVRPLRKLILPISMPGRKYSCRARAGFRLIGSEKIWDRGAALPSRLRWFETEVLSQAGNLEDLRRINRELIARRRP